MMSRQAVQSPTECYCVILQMKHLSSRDELMAAEMIKDLRELFGCVLGRSCSSDAKPENPKNWHNEGISLMNKYCYEDAANCFDQAAQLDPMDAMAWNNQGICYLSLSRFEDALECIEKAIEIDSDYTRRRPR